MKYKYCIIIFGLLIISGCKSKKERWVNSFCAAFEENTFSDSIDWTLFRETVSESYDTSKYLAIEKGLTINNNRHSFYRIQNQMIKGNYGIIHDFNSCNYNSSIVKNNISNQIGYVNIPTFITDPDLSKSALKVMSTDFINEIYNEIRIQDKQILSGWIIDLRFNRGGNMWPMLLALRPFLENGVLGFFINDKSQIPWKYDKNKIYNGKMNANHRFLSKSIDYELKNKSLPIAVLVGSRTSSSGEAVAIAAQSIPSMKYFGDSTSGFSTGNKTIKVEKNEFLTITGTTMANYNKKKFTAGIKVDSVICDEERLINEILGWILKYGK